ASDRGDAERGLSLLRRAGAPADDDLVVLLTHFRPVERRDLGRNDPCWCGSGRKYKVCHRNNETLPLADRAAWLYQKAGTYLADGPWRGDVIDVAEIRAQHWDQPGAMYLATQDPLVCDAVLFEGGAFAAFLTERGGLLPDDERLLAEQWLLTDRSNHEVETVTPGSGFTARDLRTGERIEVRERTASRTLQPGMLICARLVPSGDTYQCFGGLEPVPLHQRDRLLELLDSEPDPAQLVACLSARFAPTVLQNTEGEPLVLCSATLSGGNTDALTAALDTTYDRDEDELLWIEHVTTHGMERIRATITIEDATVRVETNSEPRMDRVLDTLLALQLGLQVQTQTRRPAEDLQEAMSRAPAGVPASTFDPTDPAIADALEQFTRTHDQTWLDEPIPALSGVTPRAAASDPTRRPDLIRLLDSFGPAAPGTMDPDRLRAQLGL
ncbi:MAG: SEC-C domain-containing protein, partial [Marmoricola sp.]